MRTIIYCIALSFFFFSTLTLHAQEIDIPSKYGSASSEASKLMQEKNVTMSQECGNITVTIGGNTKTKLVVTGNILIATTNAGKDLTVFSYQTYEDTVKVYSVNLKTQRFTVKAHELKQVSFKDCNCEDEYQPRKELKNLAQFLQLADPGQWFNVHMLGGYEYWEIRYYKEETETKGFVKPRSMKCCSTGFELK